MRTDSVRLSVVIPVFGGASTLAHEIDALRAVLDTCEPSHELIIVVDGDREAFEVACGLEGERVQAVGLEENRGEGAAVILGMQRASGELIGFIDAGGDIDPQVFATLVQLQREHDADAVVGSKWHAGSEVSYPLIRRAYSVGYHALVRALFRLDVRDTQVGVKVFRAALVRDVVPQLSVQRFAFDVELLAVARHLGYRRVVEAPVRITHNFRSTVSTREVARMLWDTLGVAWRLHVLGSYHREGAAITDAEIRRA
ncbi:MAG: glycosyltransferase [Chloroflexi bacterium]|nr:MAG: glycosyltransferase [Chloroflexota bacterium]